MKFLNDLLGQLWTLVGLGVAWILLEGSARTIVGWVILGSLALWMATYPLRNKE
jgi:hypothetical protein